MGADLYIEARFSKTQDRWRKRFEKAVACRDAAPKGSAEEQRLQRIVERYYGRMFGNGYFRDSYNSSNLLWQFRLSWWEDVIPMLDGAGELTPAKARLLRSMLKSRGTEFEASMAEHSAASQKYFRKKYKQLEWFLTEAIEANEPILCSL